MKVPHDDGEGPTFQTLVVPQTYAWGPRGIRSRSRCGKTIRTYA